MICTSYGRFYMGDPASNWFHAIAIIQNHIFCQESPHLPLPTITSTSSLASSARPSGRRHPPPSVVSSVADDLPPWCRPGHQAADAAAARRGRRANAEDAVVVPLSPPVALALPRPHSLSPPALSLTAASAQTWRPLQETCARINSFARRGTFFRPGIRSI